MPLNCFVPQCFVNNRKCKGVSFFGFPKNSILKKKWLISIKNAREPNRWSKVCSRHFTEEDFISAKDEANVVISRKLREGAIPHCHLPLRKLGKSLVCHKNEKDEVNASKNHKHFKIRTNPCFNLEKSEDSKPKLTHKQVFCVMSFTKHLKSYTDIESIKNFQAKKTSYSPVFVTSHQQSTFNVTSSTAPKKCGNILKNSESHSIFKCRQKSQTNQIQRHLSTDTVTSEESIYLTNLSPTIPKISVNSKLQTTASCYLSKSRKHSVAKQPSNYSVGVNTLQLSTPSVYLMKTIPQKSASTVLSLQDSKSCSIPKSRQNLITRKPTDIAVDSTLHHESKPSTNYLATPPDGFPNSTLQTPKLLSILKSSKNPVLKVPKTQFTDILDYTTTQQESASSSNPQYKIDKVTSQNRNDAVLVVNNEVNLDCSLAKLKMELQKERLG